MNLTDGNIKFLFSFKPGKHWNMDNFFMIYPNQNSNKVTVRIDEIENGRINPNKISLTLSPTGGRNFDLDIINDMMYWYDSDEQRDLIIRESNPIKTDNTMWLYKKATVVSLFIESKTGSYIDVEKINCVLNSEENNII